MNGWKMNGIDRWKLIAKTIIMYLVGQQDDNNAGGGNKSNEWIPKIQIEAWMDDEWIW